MREDRGKLGLIEGREEMLVCLDLVQGSIWRWRSIFISSLKRLKCLKIRLQIERDSTGTFVKAMAHRNGRGRQKSHTEVPHRRVRALLQTPNVKTQILGLSPKRPSASPTHLVALYTNFCQISDVPGRGEEFHMTFCHLCGTGKKTSVLKLPSHGK